MNLESATDVLAASLSKININVRGNIFLMMEEFLFAIDRPQKLANVKVEDEIIGIYNEQFKGKPLHKATTTDLVWCYITKRLISLGFTIEDIKIVRQNLSVKINNRIGDLQLLEFCLKYVAKYQTHCCLNIHKDGRVKFIDLENDQIIFDTESDDEFYIQFLLNKLLQKANPELEFQKSNSSRKILNEKESKLIDILRKSTNVSSVNIKTTNGQLKSADVFEHLPLDDKKYFELLNERSFQTLTVKREDGKDCYIERNYREFFN